MILETKYTGPLEVNTYILKDEESKEAIIIDIGGEFSEIKNVLDKDDYKVKCILNTHGHFDHVLGEPYIQEMHPEIPIYIHKDDLVHIKNLETEMRFFNFRTNNSTKLDINNFIDENSEIKLGNKTIKVLHTPGHSKGSVSFYIENKVFTGDALFYHSIGRTDLYDGDYDTLIESIKTKLLTLPEDTIVYPGHGPSTTIKKEKLNNPYLK